MGLVKPMMYLVVKPFIARVYQNMVPEAFNAIATCRAKVVRIKNLVQGLWTIGREEGWHVLFKGLGPACFEKVPSTAIGYYIYEAMKVAMKVSSV